MASTSSSSALSDTTMLTASPGLSAGVTAEVKPLPCPDPDVGAWLARFDAIYDAAGGDIAKIPWAHRRPCPWMVAWMNAEAPALIRCGARVAVVGCGLGTDAIELRERGYDVVGFDASPAAIHWAKTLHPDHADMFMQADLLDLPSRLHNRFDLVVEVHTLQSLPPKHRPALARGMASMLAHSARGGGGVLLAICRGRSPSVPVESLDGPPFPLTRDELVGLMEQCGLGSIAPVDEFADDNTPPTTRIRGAFRRA